MRVPWHEPVNPFSERHGNRNESTGPQERRRLLHDTHRIGQVFQNLEQRDQIECPPGLRRTQFMQKPFKNCMPLRSGLGCGVAIEFNTAGFVTGLFREIQKGAAATTHVQDPAQIFFPGEPESPHEFRPIRRVIPCVLNLAIEGFISNQLGVKERKTALLTTVQFHGESFMNSSPGIRGKFTPQLLPKLSQLRPAELFGNVAFRAAAERTVWDLA